MDFGPVEDQSNQIIKVIGVGGGGCNAVHNMYREGIVNVSFAVCNTDSQILAKSPVPVKLQLGETGLGAGGKPEVGKQEAINTKEQIRKLFDDNTKMCFITAAMGGGTGTGAAPVIASVAKNLGILTIGIVTIPFFFEKRRKIIKALKGVEEMRKNVDSLLIINNERLCDIYSDAQMSVKDALKAADRILSDATKSISELITVEGTINLDFRDVESTMRGGGGAIMAIGRAGGDRRVEKAISDALNSPLLYGSDITKAKNILFNIYASEKNPVFVSEMQEVDSFMYRLNPNVDVIWGTSDDNTLDGDAKVVILATGINNEFSSLPKDEEEQQDEAYYDNIISKLYREPIPGKPFELTLEVEKKPDESGANTAPPTELNGEDEDSSTGEKDGSNTITKEKEIPLPPPPPAPKRKWFEKVAHIAKNKLKEVVEDVKKVTNDDDNDERAIY